MKYSFKKFVENKELNEVGQYVFDTKFDTEKEEKKRQTMIRASNAYRNYDMPDYSGDYEIFDKKNQDLGWDDYSEKKGVKIFKVYQTPSGAEVSFTEEMKKHLNNNNKKVGGTPSFFLGDEDTYDDHQENEMIVSIGKSMLSIAGGIVWSQLQETGRFFNTEKQNMRIVSFEPVFKFLEEGMKGNVSVFKRIFPLFERGIKTVVHEVKQEYKRDVEKSKNTKYWQDPTVSTYDAITKGTKYNVPNKYYGNTKIELQGYNVVFSPANAPDNFNLPSDQVSPQKSNMPPVPPQPQSPKTKGFLSRLFGSKS